MDVLSSNKSNLILALLTDINWDFISSLAVCQLAEQTMSNKKALATLDSTVHKMNLMSFSSMIIKQLLCSFTYVHLCKCLICEIKKDWRLLSPFLLFFLFLSHIILILWSLRFCCIGQGISELFLIAICQYLHEL